MKEKDINSIINHCNLLNFYMPSSHMFKNLMEYQNNINIITIQKLQESNDPRIKDLDLLIDESKNSRGFKNNTYRTRKGYDQNLNVIFKENNVAGIIAPTLYNCPDGTIRWHSGGIFISMNYRNYGIGSHVMKEFFKDKPGYDWVANWNIPSQIMLQKSGFIKCKPIKFGHLLSENGYDWYKD